MKIPRRFPLPVLAALSLLFVQCAALHLVRASIHDRGVLPAPAVGKVDDASRLNESEVGGVVDVARDDARAIAQIRDAFSRARAAKTGVSIAGFRHSMGGHTIAPRGIVLNMLAHDGMELLPDGEVLRVQGGAAWKNVIEYLEPRGRSVAVMQSDNPFTVGGSLSVNCHGWQHLHPPVASTVMAMRVLLPDGQVVRCSRDENPGLFAHVLGGYGLFGVILDADLRTVPNERYRMARYECDIDAYEAVFASRARSSDAIKMSYGRLSVAPESFLREAILTTYTKEDGPVPPIRPESGLALSRAVFRGSVGSAYGKRLRWMLERRLQPRIERKHVSRNEVLSHTIESYVNHRPDSTDVLHEYFVPRGKLASFINDVRPVLRHSGVDLLNITIRDVTEDDTTALRYARGDVFAVVMYFNQKRSESADARMQLLTRDLIDKALDAGGTYYLPYRPHASPYQLQRAYPSFADFVREKRRVDPEEILTNQWYLRYAPSVR